MVESQKGSGIMTFREVVSALMCSELYFSLSLRERLNLARKIWEKMGGKLEVTQ